MSDVIISVEGLGKKYVLSHQGSERGGYNRFSEKLESWIKKPFAALAASFAGSGKREVERGFPPTSCPLPLASKEEFWALKGVSFEVKRGEVVGIIGRNGAGKSTLLKILSRITEPTEGRVTLRGRVASLLEVGTGFHPELTGRENIFLNGAILGMTKAEIKKKFDEIVAFAEVERFLDTPVKRYSSGMYVRLAFAVAAHLEPEILVVDEVLAVGDAEFQKKCLGKMKDVAAGGRTVLFVSHNLSTVKALCSIGLELQKGKVCCFGEISKVINSYKQGAQNNLSIIPDTSKEIYITEVRTESMYEKTTKVVAGENLKIVIKYKKRIKHIGADFCFTIFSSMDVAVAHLKTSISGETIRIKQDEGSVECNISVNPLNIGHYRIAAAIMSISGETLDLVSRSCSFEVIASNIYKSGKYPDPKYSIIQLEGVWCHE